MATQWKPMPFSYVKPGEVFALGLVFPLVCIVLVSARLYVRRLQKQKLLADDWTAILAVILLAGMGACLITGEQLGIMGYPMPVPAGTQASDAYALFNQAYITEAKIEFAMQFLQCFQFALVKSSIVLFIRRVFVTHRGTIMDWASMILLVVINVWSVAFLMALIFGCGKNVALHWGPLEQLVASGCDGVTPEKANLISDPILDFLILVLPLPSVRAAYQLSVFQFALTVSSDLASEHVVKQEVGCHWRLPRRYHVRCSQCHAAGHSYRGVESRLRSWL